MYLEMMQQASLLKPGVLHLLNVSAGQAARCAQPFARHLEGGERSAAGRSLLAYAPVQQPPSILTLFLHVDAP